jgi:hypothetical protein
MNAAVMTTVELALNSYLRARERLEQIKAVAVVASEKYHDLFLQDDPDSYELSDAEFDMNHAWDCYTNELRKFSLEESYARKIGVIE